MTLEALAQKINPISKTNDRVKVKAVKAFEKLKINQFLDLDSEVFEYDEEYVPEVIW